MKFVCPQRWEALESTVDADIRHCTQCNESVYRCSTPEETLARARAGHCIARERPADDAAGPMIVGRPAIPHEPTAEEREARKRLGEERGIDALLRGRILDTERTCAECRYPIPEYRKSCLVCGNVVGRAL